MALDRDNGTTVPLGIADLTLDQLLGEAEPGEEIYFWCRRHRKSHRAGEKCKNEKGYAFYKRDRCVDVGPFMSEREAQRLDGYAYGDALEYGLDPLGMEIERW